MITNEVEMGGEQICVLNVLALQRPVTPPPLCVSLLFWAGRRVSERVSAERVLPDVGCELFWWRELNGSVVL